MLAGRGRTYGRDWKPKGRFIYVSLVIKVFLPHHHKTALEIILGLTVKFFFNVGSAFLWGTLLATQIRNQQDFTFKLSKGEEGHLSLNAGRWVSYPVLCEIGVRRLWWSLARTSPTLSLVPRVTLVDLPLKRHGCWLLVNHTCLVSWQTMIPHEN